MITLSFDDLTPAAAAALLEFHAQHSASKAAEALVGSAVMQVPATETAPVTQPEAVISQAPATTQSTITIAPRVPTASAPAYTLDQISRAGAALVDAGKMEQLLALLERHGVQAVTQLQPEQYGAFATELRALGAQI